ncbi:IS3 family transposase [Lactiplantibacillus plantarum]|uniref:IS3 family transposase n=1 Tax=Lactiplantibacillus plantarum TaxID=1590 RepID=UPI0022B6FDCF|nr:IS3 family transposase [Lactiplantibacillus plantarum]WBB04825.1 IS3 family transposase [Lactiplantibacillus plantarum]
MCRILGVSRAQYYRYRSPKPSKRRAEDADLKQRILRIFAEFKQRYGVMKIHHELNLELQPLQRRCSPRRISRLMKELDIHSVTVNKWKAASASKTKVEQRPTLLKQDFSTTGLNQKWTADMTYIQRSVMAGVTDQPSWICTQDELSAIHSQKRWLLI